ncbi:hypothetical protein OG524_36190 [Streptomyces sp. NBC_01520]|uniref:hypothetical protein n=1 Tax=Streptomyces sp. NBC_01520 TaxID=2903892 RepID=UPI0038658AB3
MLDAVRSGDVRLPAGEGKEAFIDAEDIAAVAVTALTQDGHAGQTYELSGPRLMSFADAVSDIARATGNDIRYTPLSAETYAAEQRASGVPEEWVQLAIGMYADIRSGALNSLTGDVEKVLGARPATSPTTPASLPHRALGPSDPPLLHLLVVEPAGLRSSVSSTTSMALTMPKPPHTGLTRLGRRHRRRDRRLPDRAAGAGRRPAGRR